MNRKERRITQSQDKHRPTVNIRGKSCTIEEAVLLAIKECNLRNFQAAAAIFQSIIAKVPQYADAYNNLGNILQETMRYEEALANYDKAIALKPDYTAAYCNRGVTLQKLHRFEEALESCNKAIAFTPDYAEAYYTRGLALQALKRDEEALANYETAIALNPNIPCLLGALLHSRMQLCNWQGYEGILAKLAEKIAAGQSASAPLIVLATPLPAALQHACAQTYVRDKFPSSTAKLWNGEKYSHDRIRVGYFSADLHNHATAHLMAEFFELHDRTKFEVTAFSFGPPSNHPIRKRLEKAFEHFIDVSAKSDYEIAALARSREIDIAVDLKGFTQDARTGVFAMRPAPVQVNYLGYPGTMGADYIDYLVADPTIIPKEHIPFYSEKIVYLPDSYQANDSSGKISEKLFTRQEMGLPENGFVFCCFNNSFKITPDVFDIWMRLLHKVEGSVLWLFEANPTASKNLRSEAQTRGISGDRLIFAKRLDREDHLARQRLADVFLDTFHYNAHTTTSDALWAGLPVLTRLGETFAGRVAASLLNAANMPELITHSHAEYEALALEFATHPEKLAAIREKLAKNRAACPLFNTRLFTGHFEDAYVQMWRKSQAGLPSEHIYVNPPVAL